MSWRRALGSRNPHNMVKATFAALQKCASPRSVATRRGKKVSELFGAPVIKCLQPRPRPQRRLPPMPKVRVTQTASPRWPQAWPEGEVWSAWG